MHCHKMAVCGLSLEFNSRLQGLQVAFQGMQVLCIFKVHRIDQYTALTLKRSAHFSSFDFKDLSWTCLNRSHS